MSRHLHQGALNRKMLIAALVDCANACTNSDKPAVGCRGDSRPGDRSIDASRMPRRSDNAGPGPSITAETVLRDVPIHDWTAATRRSDRPPEGSDNGHVEPSLWSATGTCGSARGRLCGTRTAEQELTEQPAAVNRNEGRRVLAIGQTPTEHRFATAASAGDHLGSRIDWRAMQPSIDPQEGHNLCRCTIRQYKRIGHTIGHGIGHTIGQWHLARRPQIARRRPLVQNFGMAYGGPRWMTSAQWRERMPCS